MDDLTAIEKCKAGESEAFSHLVRKYQSEAIGHALAVLGRREDALDAAQHAFLDAYQALERFDISRRFYPWLYTILRNRCYKILASREKHSAGSIDEIELLAQPLKDVAGTDVRLVDRVLRELSAQDRELLTLKHLDGLCYNELAERLEIPSGTVMSRLYYARKRFREKLDSVKDQVNSEEMNDD
ncbi:MAG: RNA polymerase sigma factor [Planctomycetota bacterium]